MSQVKGKKNIRPVFCHRPELIFICHRVGRVLFSIVKNDAFFFSNPTSNVGKRDRAEGKRWGSGDVY
jgi:hypothetical protein